MRRVALPPVLAVALAPVAGAVSPLPVSLQAVAEQAFPGSSFVRLCLRRTPSPVYAYALVRSGGRQRSAVFVHRDEGPAAGSVYFARYGGRVRCPRRPAWDVVRPAGRREWSDEGDTGGELCESRIPLPVLKLWGWTQPSTVGTVPGYRCFVRRG